MIDKHLEFKCTEYKYLNVGTSMTKHTVKINMHMWISKYVLTSLEVWNINQYKFINSMYFKSSGYMKEIKFCATQGLEKK